MCRRRRLVRYHCAFVKTLEENVRGWIECQIREKEEIKRASSSAGRRFRSLTHTHAHTVQRAIDDGSIYFCCHGSSDRFIWTIKSKKKKKEKKEESKVKAKRKQSTARLENGLLLS